MKTLWISLRLLLSFTLVLGVIYPLAMTGLGQVLFPVQANGSLVRENGKVMGSSLIGQDFSSTDKYFQGRPPATSGASNLSPWGQTFKTQVTDRTAAWAGKPGMTGELIPQELVTTSASGLDPDIPLEAALFQVSFLGAARKISDLGPLETLVLAQAKRPLFPWDPASYVNILELNRALDNLYGKP